MTAPMEDNRAGGKSRIREEEMAENIIDCPHCGRQFELTEALSGKLREHLREEMQGEVRQREEDLERKLRDLQGQKEELARRREAIGDEIEKGLREKLAEERGRAEEKAREAFAAELADMKESLSEKTKYFVPSSIIRSSSLRVS